MNPNHLALWNVTSIARSVANSAMPNAPVVDDSNDRVSVGKKLAGWRKRLAALVSPDERVAPAPTSSPASFPIRDAVVAGC